jgi:hypothetical protein
VGKSTLLTKLTGTFSEVCALWCGGVRGGGEGQCVADQRGGGGKGEGAAEGEGWKGVRGKEGRRLCQSLSVAVVMHYLARALSHSVACPFVPRLADLC